MKKLTRIVTAILGITALWTALALAQPPAATPVPADTRKQTTLGKYCSSMEAYLMWRAKPKEVVILDVRTPEEYSYVGHAEMAVNVPVMLGTGVFEPEKKAYALAANPDFAAQVSKRLDKKATILVMCRSGQRAAAAVNLLAKDGFTNVYNIVDSFEGDMVTDPESVYLHKRMKNGWKNYNLPWTYALDPALVWSK